jgi:hypothetical protein
MEDISKVKVDRSKHVIDLLFNPDFKEYRTAILKNNVKRGGAGGPLGLVEYIQVLDDTSKKEGEKGGGAGGPQD